jgi:hypothetical protein
MTEGEFFLNDEMSEELRAHYVLSQKKISEYPKELSRSLNEWKIKKAEMERAYGGSLVKAPLFCVYGKNLSLDEMIDVYDRFQMNRPEDSRIELMFLLHEKGDVKKIKAIMSEAESFLRLLPGALIPVRPLAMKELMKVKI